MENSFQVLTNKHANTNTKVRDFAQSVCDTINIYSPSGISSSKQPQGRNHFKFGEEMMANEYSMKDHPAFKTIDIGVRNSSQLTHQVEKPPSFNLQTSVLSPKLKDFMLKNSRKRNHLYNSIDAARSRQNHTAMCAYLNSMNIKNAK